MEKQINEKAIQDAREINRADLWIKPTNPVGEGQGENANIKVVQSFFMAYGNPNPQERLAGIKAVMAEDVEWYIPGRHKLSGIKRVQNFSEDVYASDEFFNSNIK